MDNFKLSPSDFAFLWEFCKRCFYLKVARDFKRPRSILPKIFITIDSKMNKCFDGVRTEKIADGVPSGSIKYGQKWVQSAPISIPGVVSTCYIRGRFDTVIELDDGTFAVVDFKTSSSKGSHLNLYSRQLHAYSYALENPAQDKFSLSPITKLGLLVFEPTDFFNKESNTASLEGKMKWIEIERNDSKFIDFLAEVVSLLENPSPPDSSPSCDWCQYRKDSRKTIY